MHKICWKSIITGTTGCGKQAYPKSQAQKFCNQLNRENRGMLHHWIEPVEIKPERVTT